MPAHYHLHHLHPTGAGAHEHEHAIDLHLLNNDTDRSHHEEDTSIFAATPDVIVKKGSLEVHPYLLLVVMMIVLTVFRSVSVRPGTRKTSLRQLYHYFSPPLRAPPLH